MVMANWVEHDSTVLHPLIGYMEVREMEVREMEVILIGFSPSKKAKI